MPLNADLVIENSNLNAQPEIKEPINLPELDSGVRQLRISTDGCQLLDRAFDAEFQTDQRVITIGEISPDLVRRPNLASEVKLTIFGQV